MAFTLPVWQPYKGSWPNWVRFVLLRLSTEQSGVGHMITYLTPLIVKEVFQNERMLGGSDDHWGWAVEGSPADCVKIGLGEFCPRRPDLVISGINAGLNAGINVLYSGTVAAAIEGAFYGITSIAISLQYERHFQFERAACLARQIVEQILSAKGPDPQLYNVNIPTAALAGEPQVSIVPMNVNRDDDRFEKRQDPFGRPYYWLIGGRAPLLSEHETDISAIAQGRITITPLDVNMTAQTALAEMETWQIRFSPPPDSPRRKELMKTFLLSMVGKVAGTLRVPSARGPRPRQMIEIASRHSRGGRQTESACYFLAQFP